MRDPREAETDFHVQRQVILGLLLLVCVFVAGFVGYEGIPYALTRLDRQEVTGTVTKIEKRNQTRIIWYEFTATNGETYERYVGLPFGTPFTTYKGASIDVVYFPLMPRYSDLRSLLRYRHSPMVIALGALGASGVIIILLFWSGWSYRRYRNRMHYY